MAQYSFGTIDPNTKSGTALASDLNSYRDAVNSTHSGSSAPSYVTGSMLWSDTTSADYELKMYDGAQWITLAILDATNNVARVAVDSAETSYITSTTAAQIKHVIASVDTMTVRSTGLQFNIASPIIGDSSNNELLSFTTTASAVNHIDLANAATSGAPTISAVGGDTDIGITLTPKGAGVITLTGTAQFTGVGAFADGSAAAPSITNDGDLNTGIFFPAADTIAFSEGGTEVMRIDASANVGIGTTAAEAKFHLSGGSALISGDNTQIAQFTASISGTTMTVTAVDSGTIAVGDIVFSATVATNTRITALGTGTGGTGTYTVGVSQTVSSDTIRSCSGTASRLRLSDTDTTAANGQPSGVIEFFNNDVGGGDTAPGIGAYIAARAEDSSGNIALVFGTRNNSVDAEERARIDSTGVFLVGRTAAITLTSTTAVGATLSNAGSVFYRSANPALIVGRQTSDGTLVEFRQAGALEGNISVSGTTVSYNGGHLSRWAQLPDNSRPELLKGTVMSNLDQMSNWDDEANEQLNCVEVSAVEGDPDVAGVFVAWDTTDDGYNDILLAMTGDMVIRIAGGVTVQRGDLLMSAGDGTAKPQGDDIVRSKTIAKVTSTHVSHTYADGSYAVPCVLMAC